MNKDTKCLLNIISKGKEPQKQIAIAPNEKIMNEMLNSKVNYDLLNRTTRNLEDKHTLDIEPDVSNLEIKESLRALNAQYSKDKMTKIVDACFQTAIYNLTNSLGLSKILFSDKEGGNVTTLHNAKNNVFANEEDKNRFTKYDRTPYESEFSKKRRALLQKRSSIIDEYTGKELTKDGRMHLDHVIPVKEIHEEGKLFIQKDKMQKFVNSDVNLKPTNASLNMSKKDCKVTDWMDKEARGNKGCSNAKKYKVNKKLALSVDNAARNEWNHLLSRSKIEKYSKEITYTGVGEGYKLGLQQAIGLILSELLISVVEEVKDIFSNGFKTGQKEESILSVCKKRIGRVAKRIKNRWKDVCVAFRDGFISGFISNLVTFIINTIMTTAKRMVRIIREGIYSFYKAIKMLLFPPEGLTLGEAAHEAIKILGAGVFVAIGISIEEFIEKSIMTSGLLAPFATILSSVLNGIMTGIGTALLTYFIDKIDLFGVVKKEKNDFLNKGLDHSIQESLLSIESILQM